MPSRTPYFLLSRVLTGGLAAGVALSVVVAIAPSAQADTILLPTAPDAPTITAVAAADGTASVHWTPPANDGGTPVTNYVVRAEPSGRTVWADSGDETATITGLANGVATTLEVAAKNAVGRGDFAVSRSVTPRKPARLVVTNGPAHHVVHGTRTAVHAALVSPGGQPVTGQVVQLWARVRPSNKWRQVSAAHTGSNGGVTLHTMLAATAALRLQHPTGAVVAPVHSMQPVAVANSATARVDATNTRVGNVVTVHGRVGPNQPIGSVVRLQRHRSNGWHTIAHGRMRTARHYRIRWMPPTVGGYRLRVVKPGGSVRAPGISHVWRERVLPETAADIARDILHNPRIKLTDVHASGVRDGATALQNIIDLANGRLAHNSCYQNAPCGVTGVQLGLLRALRLMGMRGRVEVSEIAGGSHAPNSKHYAGRALDIDAINGVAVAAGADYSMVVETCRAEGATTIYDPGYDPYGGHNNHVHCEWDG